MHDIQFIRENPEAFDAGLKRRGLEAKSTEILALDAKRRELLTTKQGWEAELNKISKTIGDLLSQKQNADKEKAYALKLKEDITAAGIEVLGTDQTTVVGQLQNYLDSLPNLPAADVPDGADENDNVEEFKFKEPTKFDFEPKDHLDLLSNLDLLDMETAAKLSGARFYLFKGQLARLYRALGQYALDIVSQEFGFTEVATPLMVKSDIMYGVGQLPKFADDMFHTNTDHWLITTAEVPLTCMVADKIVQESDLPLRFTAYTPCFRSEAGAAGRDTRGIFRTHQFYKVEMVTIATPEQSVAEHALMLSAAETILQNLELPYRRVALCTGDMGFASQKTYDLEVWLPGQNKYREVGSISNCGSFQARRMNARYKNDQGKNIALHTLNGTAMSGNRPLIAILENYQNQDGSITVPQALRPYMNGLEVISKA